MSKICVNCGKILDDDNATYCPNCGNSFGGFHKQSGLLTTAYVFMIISCVIFGWMILPLAWLIPMTVRIKNRMKGDREPISLAFKICTLIFCNIISGILLLCDSNA